MRVQGLGCTPYTVHCTVQGAGWEKTIKTAPAASKAPARMRRRAPISTCHPECEGERARERERECVCVREGRGGLLPPRRDQRRIRVAAYPLIESISSQNQLPRGHGERRQLRRSPPRGCAGAPLFPPVLHYSYIRRLRRVLSMIKHINILTIDDQEDEDCYHN